MKNTLRNILMFVMTLTLSACSFIKVGWDIESAPGNMAASYILFTGAERGTVELAEGETLVLSYDATVRYGTLSIEVEVPNGKEVWQAQIEDDKKVEAEIPAARSGQYKIVVTGQNTSGDFAASWTTAVVRPPEQVVNEFYDWYLGRVSDPAGPGNVLTDRTYRSNDLLTPEFITKVDAILDWSERNGPGYDPFLCAQNVPLSLTVDDVAVSGDTATVWVSYQSLSFTVSLTQWKDTWKIANIECSFQ